MQIKELKDEEMKQVAGGNTLPQIVNLVTKGVEALYNLGYELGSGLRRLIENNYCPLD